MCKITKKLAYGCGHVSTVSICHSMRAQLWGLLYSNLSSSTTNQYLHASASSPFRQKHLPLR